MRIRKILVPLLLWGVAGSAAEGSDVPIISVGNDGKVQVRVVAQKEYFQTIQGAVNAVHESILPALESTSSHGLWKLHTISVGLGISAQVGLGPIFSIHVKPRIRLIYTRGKEPHFP